MKMEDDLKTNGRRPKKIKNERRPQKEERKTTSKNEMEDEPINQNQPNWM